MSSWRPSFQPDHLYFVTTKAVDYVHVFRRNTAKRLLVDTLDCYRLRGRLRLYCFVIMPNHIHLIAQFSADDPLASVMRDLKQHSADRLIRHLKAEGDQGTLDWLPSKARRLERQTHKIWEDGYNAKDVVTEGFLFQKMDYIHNNPCQPHWQISETPADYAWSSARFYLTDQPCIIPMDDVRKLML